MVRTPCYDENGMKRGAWSEEEDNKLRDFIERYGHWNWRELPKYAGLSRCGKSCRLRWMNYLRPNVKRGNFTKEEDDLILKLHAQLGNKWSVFASKLSGRTDNEIKNHWHTHLKRRSKKQSPLKSEVRVQYSSKTCRPKAKPNNISMEPKKGFADADHEPPQILESCRFSQKLSSAKFSELNGFADEISPQILESCPLSLELSSSEFSSLSSDYALESAINCVAKDSILWSDAFEELNGDFWTKPFLEDNSCIQNDFQTSLLAEGVILSPYISHYDDCTC